MTINFDMDGTLADFYGVPNWLDYLMAEDTAPYRRAKPLCSFGNLARRLNMLQKQGFQLGIISWLSKNGSFEYNAQVTEVKRQWLQKHLPSVKWDEIHIVPYGTPKELFAKSEEDVLFDDEAPNRENWPGQAFDVDDIFRDLRKFQRVS